MACLIWASVQAQQSAAPASAPSSGDGQLSEIVVTAERRSERLQDVPLDVAVVTGLESQQFGTNGNMDLYTMVPGLQTSRQITGATLYLRGVGSISSPGVENAVATYVDDVYITGFAGTITAFNNIDRVEVLKGPQGTLFGRNATGGVIHVVTKDPSSTPSLDVQVGYANYDTVSTSVYGTTGLAPTVAADIAYFSREQMDGWGHDLTTGQAINLGKEYGVRSKVKWTPTDSTSVVLAADHYWDNYDYGANQTVVPGTLGYGNATFAGNYNSEGYNPYSPYGPGRSGDDRHVDSESITLTQELGWSIFKSISARREFFDYTAFDQDGGPGQYNDARWPEHLEMYSEELHLRSPDNFTLGGRNFRWLAGVYWLKMNDSTQLSTSGELLGGGLLYTGASENFTNSFAGFIDSTLEVATDTNLTVGFRETDDHIANTSHSVFVAGNGTPYTTPYGELYSDANRPTWRAILDHKWVPDLMTYASVSRGFKSGGFSLFAPGAPATKPETVDEYALGLKSEWLDHKLQANFEAYDYNYKNQQVAVIESGSLVTINAASSRIYGLDADLSATPTAALTLFGNFGYLHGRYLSFPGAPVYLQQPATCSPSPSRLPGPLVEGDLLCSFDAAGKPTIRSPTFSGNLGFKYLLGESNLGKFDLAASYYYTTTFNWDPSGQYPEGAYGLLATSIGWTSVGSRYNAQIWCTNCTNKYHDTYIAEAGPSEQKAPAEPRYFGIRVGVHF